MVESSTQSEQSRLTLASLPKKFLYNILYYVQGNSFGKDYSAEILELRLLSKDFQKVVDEYRTYRIDVFEGNVVEDLNDGTEDSQ